LADFAASSKANRLRESVACFAVEGGKTPAMIEYLKVLRLDHWLKNVFIFFGHLVAIALVPAGVPQSKLELASRIILSLVPACLIASANYIINEILDAPFDRMHPTKRFRPVPAGTVQIPILWMIMVALTGVGCPRNLVV
jgi:4-hydroxybenzoate polyprenyltransferase